MKNNKFDNTIKKIQNTLDQEQLSYNTIKEVVSLFLSDIVKSLVDGQQYTVHNFGSFYNVVYKGREGVSPKTKQPYSSLDHNVPKFKFSKKVKKVVSSSKSTIEKNI